LKPISCYTDQKESALKKIKNLYDKIKNQISNIFSYYQENNSSDEAENLKNTKEITENLELIQKIMQNLPKLGFNNYEHQQIINVLKSSIKEAKIIEKDQILTQNPTIEAINKFNLANYLNKKSQKPDYIDIYNSDKSHKPYYKDDTKPHKKKSSLKYEDPSKNIEEFDLIMSSWDSISEKIVILHNNQFNLENLYKNFLEKDEFLAKLNPARGCNPLLLNEIKEKFSNQANEAAISPSRRGRPACLPKKLPPCLDENYIDPENIKVQLLNTNPPFF